MPAIRPASKAILIDVGGVLVAGCLPAAAATWSTRLGAGPGVLASLRQDLASREVWDEALAALLPRLRGRAKTAIVSSA